MTDPASRPDPRTLPARLLAAAGIAWVLFVAFSFAFTPLRASQDEWWHLKAGKWIVENGRLPQNDLFTYTAADMRWHNHEWLAQVIFYRVFAWGGRNALGDVRALVLFKALLVAATFALVVRLAWHHARSWPVALLVALAGADMSHRTIFPRPPVFSYLIFAAWLLALYQWKAGRLRGRWLWLFVPCMVVWANLHGMCLLGIVAVGSFAAGEALEFAAARWRSRRAADGDAPAGPDPRAALRPFGMLTALTVAVTLAATANPSGYHLFTLGRNFTADPLLRKVILEMLPPPFSIRLNATFWIVVPLFAVLFIANRGRMRVGADYVLSGFFLFQALSHWRLLPLFAIASAAPLGCVFAGVLERGALLTRPGTRAALGTLAVLLGGYYVFAMGEPPPQTFFRRNMDLVRGKFMERADYPEPMMRFVREARLPDRMFSEINYCGYVMWSLSPELHKLFTDNRFDLFGSRFYPQEYTMVHALDKGGEFIGGHRIDKSWRELLDFWGINFVIISRDKPLDAALRKTGRWDLVYCFLLPDAAPDGGFNVWLRRDPKFADALRRARDRWVAQNPLDPPPDELDRQARAAAARGGAF